MRQNTAIRNNPVKEHFSFLRGMIANPRGVGSVAPSAPDLARAMASQIDINQPGPVLELGPGSGGITRGLIAHGIAPELLMAMEYDPVFARLVAAQFPGVTVMNDDAFDLDRVLGDKYPQPFAAVVSCIPLLNFPQEKRRALIESCFARMAPNAPLIQFTYGLQQPASAPPGITATRAAFVWRNLPPAHVWVFKRS